jgi:cofilin
MLSVIGLTDAVHTEFNALQKGTNRVTVFKMDVNSKSKIEIDLDRVGASESTSHEDIISMLPTDDCRYIFFNLDYMEGLGKRTKTFFVLWVPSDAKTKAKMVYASCAVPLKAKLAITCLSIQTGSTDAFDYDALVARCQAAFN